jgi:enamine deaminase RidA (YjgF/YER057c/UK114 family)
MLTIPERLRQLGHTPAEAAAPIANFVSAVRMGSLLFVSGQISESGDRVLTGRLGAELTADEGRRGAELAALGLLAHVSAETGGDLAAVKRVVSLRVFVAATPDFTQHSQVANGASDLLVAVFGEQGRHARTSIGVASLPVGAAVELDAIIELAH